VVIRDVTAWALSLAIAISAISHTIVIFGLGFTFPVAGVKQNTQLSLEVILVNSKTSRQPKKIEALAQVNLDGSGNTGAARRAKNPLPASEKNGQLQRNNLAAQLETKEKKLMTQINAHQQIYQSNNNSDQQMQKLISKNTKNLIRRSLEIASLRAQISQKYADYQKRPRRQFIGARAQEYRFAQYVEDWRLEIERIGNLNYPDAAREKKIYGNLKLTVSIKRDGSVSDIEIDRSSGYKVLDAAAIRIVELAAPFSRFPPNIEVDTDILSITRTWTFTHDNRLVNK